MSELTDKLYSKALRNKHVGLSNNLPFIIQLPLCHRDSSFIFELKKKKSLVHKLPHSHLCNYMVGGPKLTAAFWVHTEARVYLMPAIWTASVNQSWWQPCHLQAVILYLQFSLLPPPPSSHKAGPGALCTTAELCGKSAFLDQYVDREQQATLPVWSDANRTKSSLHQLLRVSSLLLQEDPTITTQFLTILY